MPKMKRALPEARGGSTTTASGGIHGMGGLGSSSSYTMKQSDRDGKDVWWMLKSQQAPGTGRERPGDRCWKFRTKAAWSLGSITEDEVLRRWGRTVMDMMEAQYAAQLLG